MKPALLMNNLRKTVGPLGALATLSRLLLVVALAGRLGAAPLIQAITSGAPTGSPATPTPVSPAVTLPAGTEIAIRTIDRINSKTADEYKEYAASLDAPVVLNGVTVLPAQTKAFFRATDIVKPGLTKRASMSLSLVAVVVSGQRVSVETSKLESKRRLARQANR